MRSGVAILLGGLLACFVGGCAQREGAISTPPSVDELPDLSALERKLPAAIAVEGQSRQPRVPLTPSFELPELTAEERTAMGMDDPELELLLFGEPIGAPSWRVAPTLGGAAVLKFGRERGGASVLHLGTTRISGVNSSRGGAATAIGGFGSSVAGRGWKRESVAQSGRLEGMTTGECGASKVSARHRTIDP